MTPQALQQELAARKTMAAIAAAKNVPLDRVLTAMQDARKEAIDKALREGKINQVQADRLLQAGPRASAAPGAGPGMGMGRGRGPPIPVTPFSSPSRSQPCSWLRTACTLPADLARRNLNLGFMIT